MSTITTINATDQPKNSRAVINTNFSNLNDDKVEETSGTLTTPTINGAIAGTCYPPMTFYSANFNAPEGFLLNGKIVPSVASNDLTVAIKGMDGNDPSASNPVYCRINGAIQSITGALSVTLADATNWFNAGSTELATNEIDYFVYLGYNATDGVVVGFSRIPYACSYDDFSATSTNEKYCAISTITNASATDYYHVIGRFAATLSAGAGYTWTVPTFTAKNLIQRPIYETRNLLFTPVWTSSGTAVALENGTIIGEYIVSRNVVNITQVRLVMGSSTTYGTGYYKISVPFTSRNYGSGYYGSGYAQDGGSTLYCLTVESSNNANFLRFAGYNASAWTGQLVPFTWASTDLLTGSVSFPIA